MDSEFTYNCSFCGKEIKIPVVCPICKSMCFCSVNHLERSQDEGQHSPEFCKRALQTHMSLTGFDSMPFTWYPSIESHTSQCTLLRELQVHMKGPWQSECCCSAGTPFGTTLPLLKDIFSTPRENSTMNTNPIILSREEISKKLSSWLGDDTASSFLSTTTQPHTPIQDWASYCNQRPLPLSSPLPLILDAPLTLYRAIHRLSMNNNVTSLDKVAIYLVGVEKEFDQWPLFLELGSLLPSTDIVLYFIGPELPVWAHGKQIRIAHPPKSSFSNNGNQVTTSTLFYFYQGFFHDFLPHIQAAHRDDTAIIPSIFAALNAGLGAYPTWMTTLSALHQNISEPFMPEIYIFTDYIAESMHISKTILHMVCGARNGGSYNEEDDADDESLCVDNDDASSSLKISKVGLNPFRKPIRVKQSTHNMPFSPNAFEVWMTL